MVDLSIVFRMFTRPGLGPRFRNNLCCRIQGTPLSKPPLFSRPSRVDNPGTIPPGIGIWKLEFQWIGFLGFIKLIIPNSETALWVKTMSKPNKRSLGILSHSCLMDVKNPQITRYMTNPHIYIYILYHVG